MQGLRVYCQASTATPSTECLQRRAKPANLPQHPAGLGELVYTVLMKSSAVRTIIFLFLGSILSHVHGQDLPLRPAEAGFGILTLNLHTWQEEDAHEKLNRVADLIARLNLEVVVFQECGQHQEAVPGQTTAAAWQAPEDTLFQDEPGGLEGNAAWLVQERLQRVHGLRYFFVWSWAHIGFGEYQEGSAVLTRWPITSVGRAVVSAEKDPSSPSRRQLVSRKIHLA